MRVRRRIREWLTSVYKEPAAHSGQGVQAPTPCPAKSRELLNKPLERFEVNHTLEHLGVRGWQRKALDPIDQPHKPDRMLEDRERLIIGIAEPVSDQSHSSGAHPVEIDLSLADPARPLERFGLRIGAGDPARNRLDMGRKRRSLETGMLKPCRNAFCAARCLPARVLGPVLALALA